MPKRDHPSARQSRGDEVDKCAGSGGDLRRRFAPWRPISVELPCWIGAMDLCGREAFVLAVVNLLEQRRDVWAVEAGELGCPQRALQWARVDGVEANDAELDTKGLGSLLTSLGQGKVGAARVAPGNAPFSFAVPGEIKLERRRQAGLPIISGRPDFKERLALSITAPARTRCPGRTQTRPTVACPPCGLRDSLTAESTRLAACAVPATSVSGRMASS